MPILNKSEAIITPALMSNESHAFSPVAAEDHGTLSPEKTYRRIYADFRSMENALFSGNIEAARDAFTRLIDESPPLAELLSRNPFPKNNSRLRAFKEFGRCLGSGDLRGARLAAEKYQ